MNNNQDLICCPTCTIKYSNTNNVCPKCGTPKPLMPNHINKTQTIEHNNIGQNNTYQFQNPQQENLQYNQYNQFNPNDQNNQDSTFKTEVRKTIIAFNILGSITLTLFLIFAGITAITYLSEYNYLGSYTFLLILVGPGIIVFSGIYLYQQMKWKSLILQYIEKKEN